MLKEMKLRLALQLAFMLVCSVISESLSDPAVYEFPNEWHLWKTEHEKSYGDDKEEVERYGVWMSNKQYIEQHNKHADALGFTLKMNKFGDLTVREFVDMYQCVKQYQSANFTALNEKYGNKFKLFDKHAPAYTIPAELDWRTSGAVTMVKDQLRCGCSYAFAAIGALEGTQALANDKLVKLSEQNIVDCSVAFGNHGCSCGDVHNAFFYVIDNDGVDTEYGYPYEAKQYQCQYKKRYRGATASGVVTVSSGDEYSLLAAVASVGPVATSIDASHTSFQFYSSGVLNLPYCSNSNLSHAMLIIGYGTYGNKDYWLLKNSWGPHWGEYGFIMMARGNGNQCGIATAASFPTL